ncbi:MULTISPECIES: ribosome-associated translation inhibitor RaiA [unclassified Dehalobacter]|uniref:ribosome hibernation-promoting factor, HPF/YfiA family n=1 Tax=unclassified Dehalobacter TaxID=2635733 RepID=UPI00037C5A74|nr:MULTISPECIES: ribosome-associated translation inhibitor RaiA [unclassified Dehalobacter]RJE47462.1 ribosomal subunit interface protein [Dehalobacter sp. MCB1]TCX48726.1 ribosome-associated translation inhibitor RaiA [Dehalobacter sp. 14DCB1]TCX56226.1 ribosome-associated translation inhibitor RaiA [Dehalobacter sp. 12DCB1]
MNINVRGKQMKITDALKDYVEKRVRKLEKYSDDFLDIQVMLSVEKERQKVEVTAPLNGFLLRGEEETDDMYSSIDLVVDKLERQMEKYRKRIGKKRIKSAKEEPSYILDDDEEIFDNNSIVKTKKFSAKLMSIDEAVMQMDLIGHNFFVFANADTEQINIVYRRKHGGYGLLEPEY